MFTRIINAYNWAYLLKHPGELAPTIIVGKVKSHTQKKKLASVCISCLCPITVEDAEKIINEIIDKSSRGYRNLKVIGF